MPLLSPPLGSRKGCWVNSNSSWKQQGPASRQERAHCLVFPEPSGCFLRCSAAGGRCTFSFVVKCLQGEGVPHLTHLCALNLAPATCVMENFWVLHPAEPLLLGAQTQSPAGFRFQPASPSAPPTTSGPGWHFSCFKFWLRSFVSLFKYVPHYCYTLLLTSLLVTSKSEHMTILLKVWLCFCFNLCKSCYACMHFTKIC